MAVVRRIREDEGPLLREVRLAALADAPSAFASTFDAEAQFTDELWGGRAGGGAAGPDLATFLAERDGEVVGLVSGYHPDPAPTTVELVSMWIAPAARRAGVGRALVAALVDWAADSGASAVELWVTRGNDAAQRLYEGTGFRTTDDVKPLPSDPCKEEVRMTRTLTADDRSRR
jgi:ribosomal protein S18 acetylase RimI-like enzyme